MKRIVPIIVVAVLAAVSLIRAQQPAFPPVTEEMLLKPSANDWLMFSRTYDAQRFSPLNQITTQNVAQLKEAFKKELPPGPHESIPIVYRGVMYMLLPGNTVQALDAATGKLIWEHKRPSGSSRAKTIAIYDDMVFNSTPDGFIEALDARTGELRWETKSSGRLTAGVIVVEGKVLTGRACAPKREDCYISAHDAKTGKEVWRFYTAAASNEPGGDTWAGAPDETRAASSWRFRVDTIRSAAGLLGRRQPDSEHTRQSPWRQQQRDSDRVAADLYSNSTIALDPDTGKLRWYYQHLPGDDWDEDYANERTLLRTAFNPDPKLVKWFNPDVKRGEQRDVAVMVGEGGGIFVIDRGNGQFLWANPFPFDTPDFLIANVDGKTGRVSLNKSKLFSGPSERRVICYWNTRSYWPTAYHPASTRSSCRTSRTVST
jgi:alcohol dehydrogenase (cytochrome c)